MNKFLQKISGIVLLILTSFPLLYAGKQEKTKETWMGVYIDNVKVGYNHLYTERIDKEGKYVLKSTSESSMRVSRLGGNPVDLSTIQEVYFDQENKPIETRLRTKMSEIETVITAQIGPEIIVFKMGEKIVGELPYHEKFYVDVPIEKIIEEDGFKTGSRYKFKILDPVSYSLSDCEVSIGQKEKVLILGEQKELCYVRSKINMLIPVEAEDWIDEHGQSWKSVVKAGFMTTTSIRMPREKAMEVADENFDIAFSTVIRSNVIFEDPQSVQKVTYRVKEIPEKIIQELPFDNKSQTLLEYQEDSALIRTSSIVMHEKDAISFPVENKDLLAYLGPTLFSQSDDPEIIRAAEQIVGEETNSWKAAKKIAEWIDQSLTPNYDVGFASASETMKTREGDCSEHTVLMVALCRAVGIPARAAVGIMYAQGIFGYHMWPEVYVGSWVSLDAKWLAVDKKSGEYFTDATHIKLGESALDENIFQEMIRAISDIIGKIKLEIIDYEIDEFE